MKERREIRHRYVRQRRTAPESTSVPWGAVGKDLPDYAPNTDPKCMTFMLGLIFFLEPEPESESEPFPGREILTCD